MKAKNKCLALTLALAMVVPTTHAKTLENQYFSLTTPDDSWLLTNDDNAMQQAGAGMMLSRRDSRGMVCELARIDFVEGLFDPAAYLERQVSSRGDVFCRSAKRISTPIDTTLARRAAKRLLFVKDAYGKQFDCKASAFNVGFGTFFIIEGCRTDVLAPMVDSIIAGIKIKGDTTAPSTLAGMVQSLKPILAKHTLPISGNEALAEASMPDSSTLALRVVIPYIKRDNIVIDAFSATKREEWHRALPTAIKLNRFIAQAIAEGKNLRYNYVDQKGGALASVLITKQEYTASLQRIRQAGGKQQ